MLTFPYRNEQLQMNLYALIVAGGSGSRMKSELPKQFIELNGKPILLHTIEAFSQFDRDIKIILVLPESQIDFWNELILKHNIKINHEIVSGGANRFESVKNGLSTIDEDGMVAIHDGVRPMVSHKIISDGFRAASQYGSAIATVDLKDSIRQLSKEGSTTVNRANYKIVQTPQTFDVSLIQKAYQQKQEDSFTDDASVLEQGGGQIHLVEGDYSNIKITTPEDLIVAESLLSKR